MKSSTGFFIALTLAVLVDQASAQQKPQISMDVRKKQATETEQKATRYTSTKEQDRTIELAIQLRNNDPKEQSFTVSWYFIGNPLKSGLENFVYDKGEQALTMGPRTATNLLQTSKSLEAKIAASRHSSSKEGAKPLGYIVVLAQETNLIAVSASPMAYDKVARNAAELAKLLAVPPPVGL